MFENCKALKLIEYPDEITAFKEKVFKNCESLEEFTIKSSIKSIGKDCFDGCVNLSLIRSFSETAPTTVTYSFGEIATNSYAGYITRSVFDSDGSPHNKLFIPSMSTGYIDDNKSGLLGWGVLVNTRYGNFEVNETL